MRKIFAWLLLASLFWFSRPLLAGTVEIRAVEGMKYDPPRLTVAPGQVVALSFQNADSTDQPHNLVVVKPGRVKAVLEAALALGADGPGKDYVPESGDILAVCPLIKAGEGTETAWTVPVEPGIYPYVCTFPGHGFLMFGALYVGVPMPPLAEDVNVPASAKPDASAKSLIAPFPRPCVQRAFLPGAGPAAIAVALPGRQNFCWDAGECRLRYAWTGGFIDEEAYFKGKGGDQAVIQGKTWWTAAAGFPLRPGGQVPKILKFKGYWMREGLPEFRYLVDGVEVREWISEGGKGELKREFQVTGEGPVSFFQPPVEGVLVSSDAGAFDAGGVLALTREQARKFTIILQPK